MVYLMNKRRTRNNRLDQTDLWDRSATVRGSVARFLQMTPINLNISRPGRNAGSRLDIKNS